MFHRNSQHEPATDNTTTCSSSNNSYTTTTRSVSVDGITTTGTHNQQQQQTQQHTQPQGEIISQDNNNSGNSNSSSNNHNNNNNNFIQVSPTVNRSLSEDLGTVSQFVYTNPNTATETTTNITTLTSVLPRETSMIGTQQQVITNSSGISSTNNCNTNNHIGTNNYTSGSIVRPVVQPTRPTMAVRSNSVSSPLHTMRIHSNSHNYHQQQQQQQQQQYNQYNYQHSSPSNVMKLNKYNPLIHHQQHQQHQQHPPVPPLLQSTSTSSSSITFPSKASSLMEQQTVPSAQLQSYHHNNNDSKNSPRRSGSERIRSISSYTLQPVVAPPILEVVQHAADRQQQQQQQQKQQHSHNQHETHSSLDDQQQQQQQEHELLHPLLAKASSPSSSSNNPIHPSATSSSSPSSSHSSNSNTNTNTSKKSKLVLLLYKYCQSWFYSNYRYFSWCCRCFCCCCSNSYNPSLIYYSLLRENPNTTTTNNSNSNNNSTNAILLAIAILAWFTVGVVAIVTTKLLLTDWNVPPIVLTIQQLALGSLILRTVLNLRTNCNNNNYTNNATKNMESISIAPNASSSSTSTSSTTSGNCCSTNNINGYGTNNNSNQNGTALGGWAGGGLQPWPWQMLTMRRSSTNRCSSGGDGISIVAPNHQDTFYTNAIDDKYCDTSSKSPTQIAIALPTNQTESVAAHDVENAKTVTNIERTKQSDGHSSTSNWSTGATEASSIPTGHAGSVGGETNNNDPLLGSNSKNHPNEASLSSNDPTTIAESNANNATALTPTTNDTIGGSASIMDDQTTTNVDFSSTSTTATDPLIFYHHHHRRTSSTGATTLTKDVSSNVPIFVVKDHAMHYWSYWKHTLFVVHRNFILAGIFFSLDFLFSNSAFGMSDASFVETVKASDPICTTAIALLYKVDKLGPEEGASLVLLVFGVLLSTFGNSKNQHHQHPIHNDIVVDQHQHERILSMRMIQGFTNGSTRTNGGDGVDVGSAMIGPLSSSTSSLDYTEGLSGSILTALTVSTANLCFAFRAMNQKRYRSRTVERYQMDDINLLCRMLQIGAMFLFLPTMILYGLFIVTSTVQSPWANKLAYLGLSAVNAISYATYNLASTFVLSKLTVLHHSSLNCLRRMGAILATSIFFAVPMTSEAILGLITSFFGFGAFTFYRQARLQKATAVPTKDSNV